MCFEVELPSYTNIYKSAGFPFIVGQKDFAFRNFTLAPLVYTKKPYKLRVEDIGLIIEEEAVSFQTHVVRYPDKSQPNGRDYVTSERLLELGMHCVFYSPRDPSDKPLVLVQPSKIVLANTREFTCTQVIIPSMVVLEDVLRQIEPSFRSIDHRRHIKVIWNYIDTKGMEK